MSFWMNFKDQKIFRELIKVLGFVNLCPVTFIFKVLIDKQKLDSSAGNLVLLGSHVTEMSDVIGGSTSALYGRGFTVFQFHPLIIYDNLKNHFSITAIDFLQLYTCFDGVIALYAELFKEGALIHPTFTDMALVIQKLFGQDPYYAKQLGSNECRVLSVIADEGAKTLGYVTSSQSQTIGLRVPALMSKFITLYIDNI
jgi:hypothetical protein